MADWHDSTVREIAAPIKNALVGGPFGSNLVSNDYVAEGVPVIRGQNMGERWVSGEFVYVSREKADSLEANIARPNDIVFTQRGTLGQVSLVPSGSHSEYIVSQSQMKLTVDPRKADPMFLYYVFNGAEQQDYIRQNAIQTGVPHTNLGILRATPVSLPSLIVQRNIAHALGSLDDKIELNRRMNETLEAMARALFKDWFIDFGPVRAKMEGQQPPGLAPEIAALFPDKLDEEGKPEGWSTRPLSDLIELNPNESLKKGVVAPYLDMASLPTSGSWPDRPVTRPFGSGMRFRNGDTLLARITPCLENGKTALIQCLNMDEVGWGSTEYIVMRGKGVVPAAYCYVLARDDDFRAHAIRSMSGTSGRQRVQADSIAQYQLHDPPGEIWTAFGSMVAPWFDAIRNLAYEAETLASARDLLLPKLLSGEIRVGSAPSQPSPLAGGSPASLLPGDRGRGRMESGEAPNSDPL